MNRTTAVRFRLGGLIALPFLLHPLAVVRTSPHSAPPSDSYTVSFTEAPPPRVLLGDDVRLGWAAEPRDAVECRTKLEAPGDWTGGLRHLLNRWSPWGSSSENVLFSAFVQEGAYVYEVECRHRESGEAKSIEARWQVYWEFPEIRNARIDIDWAAAREISDRSARFAFLAEEYRQAHETFRQEFEYEHARLKLSASPGALIRDGQEAIVSGSAGMLLEWADKSVSATASRLLSPRTVYELIRQGSLDLILISRNVRANTACFNAVVTYHAWQFYRDQARR